MFHHPWRRAFINGLSPIGANPFELTVAYKERVWFDDLDYNIHLSNSSYAKVSHTHILFRSPSVRRADV